MRNQQQFIQNLTSRQLVLLLGVIIAFCSVAGVVSGPTSEFDGREAAERFVGDYNDYSYANLGSRPYGPNALGAKVGASDFDGWFVWVEFAAPWCGPCAPQAKEMKKAASSFSDDVKFLTVLTSDHEPFAPATQETAERWAKKYNLNPKHVIAEGSSLRKVPRHILFSPMGQTLFLQTGLLRANQMRQTIRQQIDAWDAWDRKSQEQ